MKYTGQKVQDAAMQEDPKALDEVIIVARQNINELDIRAKSGVVQRVDVERLNSKPMIDMSLALQGTVPGLIITNTGDLGSKPEIRIRGNSSFRKGDMANEPLYVMDGKVMSSDAFMTLNPADIQEINGSERCLSACALYGIKSSQWCNRNHLPAWQSRRKTNHQLQFQYRYHHPWTQRSQDDG